MNIEEIRSAVQVIREMADDGEFAHALEDALYDDFIEYIAEHGRESDARLAKEVLKTKKIDFSRWYT